MQSRLRVRLIGAAALCLALAGCASRPVNEIDLMPAPDVYGDGMYDPLPDQSPYGQIPYHGMLYATDRVPAGADEPEDYYQNARGEVVRLGVARIEMDVAKIDWARAREISLLKSRSEKFPIKVTGAREWGILARSVPEWLDPRDAPDGVMPPPADDQFAEAINAQLARSERKHVYIYVHGYKVVFENPVLVSAELWHFLGYQGAFIAYAWPSTPSRFAYVKDSDTAAGYARNLRLLLEFLASRTDAEQIHVIGYSNGTRLVTRALEQLALANQSVSRDAIHQRLKIGNVILTGSDLDRRIFGAYVSDGLLDVPTHMTIYMSKYDKALGISRFLTRNPRLGELFSEDAVAYSARKMLDIYADRLSLVNVSEAEGSGSGNGHGYFRKSPWVSSDVLMTLAYDLNPEQRGLVREKAAPVYAFPPDYLTRLWTTLADVNPEFAAALKARQNSASGLCP